MGKPAKRPLKPAVTARLRDPLWAVVGVALLVRVLYYATASGGAWDDPVLDADTNLALAEQLRAGTHAEPYWQPPLYPWFLSLCRGFTESLWLPRVLAAAGSCVTVGLSYSLGRQALGRTLPAVIGAGIVALHGPLLYYDGDLLPTSLGTLLATLAVWLSARMQDGLKRALAVGIVIGLATLSVGTLALLVLPAAFFTGLAGRARLAYAAVMVAALAVVLAPVVRKNQLHGGGSVVALSGGINLWIGNNPKMNETVAVRPGSDWELLANEPALVAGVQSPSEYDAYFFAKARAFCLSHPARCVLGVLEKARQLTASIEIPRNESLYVARRQSPVLALLVWRLGSVGFPWVVVFPLAVVGLIVAWQADEKQLGRGADARLLRFLSLFVLALAAGPLLFFVTGRYRVPLVPLLAIFAALGAHFLLNRSHRDLWLAAAIALGFAVWPLRLPVERVNYEAELAYLIAGTRHRRGDLAGAERSLEAALRVRPDYLEAAVNLALLRKQAGDRDGAERWLEHALSHHPHDPAAQSALRELRQ